MKSAYELAMERLEKASGPAKKLTDEQKEAIADIERVYEAKMAERRLEFEPKLAAAPPDEAEALRAKLAEALASLEAERDAKKDAVWNAE